jgi:hypothetical protein
VVVTVRLLVRNNRSLRLWVGFHRVFRSQPEGCVDSCVWMTGLFARLPAFADQVRINFGRKFLFVEFAVSHPKAENNETGSIRTDV